METSRRENIVHTSTFTADAARRAFYLQTLVWSVVGLAGGLAYRTISHHFERPGGQLAVVHTHALTLGALAGLIFLALAPRLVGRIGRAFLITWNAGLAITIGTLLVNGYLQTAGSTLADSAPLAGVSGLGHMTLTAAFVLLLIAVRPQPSATSTTVDDVAATAAVHEVAVR